MKHVATVIVNWNGKDDTIACLTSLKKLEHPDAKLSVVVVDNGSTNDSVAVIRRAHPWIKLIPVGKNLGFTGGNNIGIRHGLSLGADFVWLLNNDTLVDRQALNLLNGLLAAGAGVAGSKIYFAPGREFHKQRYQEKDRGKVLWYAGGLIDWDNMYASHRGVDEVDRGQYDQREETQFVTGCSMLVKREVFAKIGLLDDRYYLYLEDLDFCLRATRSHFRLIYVPTSLVWHVNAGSSGRPGNKLHEYYLTRNRLVIGMRYAPMRTKMALLREACRYMFFGGDIRRQAAIDFFFCRLGNQYEPVKI